jgi:pyruvate formate lyase activating enzyme
VEGIIFDIKRFAIHDGPGIRTTIFFKGCSLNCQWCHNPESINSKPEYYYSDEKIGDKIFRTKKYTGKKVTSEYVISEILKEKIFMEQSNGGVTLSGGEPLLQPYFARDILKKCKEENIHTIIDTAGNFPIENFHKIMPFTDLFLYDIKFFNSTKHKKYTGANNDLILENFKLLIKNNKNVIVRIPLIPGINLNTKELKQICDFLIIYKASNFNEINILPYHNIGKSKYTRFNKKYQLQDIEEPDENEIELAKQIFINGGFYVNIA